MQIFMNIYANYISIIVRCPGKVKRHPFCHGMMLPGQMRKSPPFGGADKAVRL